MSNYKKFVKHALTCGLSILTVACTTKDKENVPIMEVPFTDVQFTDQFWKPRIETNRTVSIPSAFKECEKNGRFDNFALAGGVIEGEHKGDFSFDDTDPYKIIEGASYSLAVQYDKKLDAYLDSVITLIASAQESDGYLTTCVTNKCTRLSGWWGNGRWERINSHELYNSGHLYEAAVAHYKATGKRSLLDVALKNADLICKVFGPNEGQKHVPSGHPIVEMALCKLYKVTQEQRYLDLARYFVEETGRCTDGHSPSEYSQDHKPILQQEEIVGHAVRAGYLYSGVADVAALTQDTAYFNALLRIWNNTASRKLYITGGIGSRAQGEGFGPDYELNNHTAYCETCASIANVYWNYRMFLATGEARFMDVTERALYNGVISGVSLSGDKFFYDNPLESLGQHDRQRWFGCACCPGNVTRFIASIPGYTYAVQGNRLFVNLFVESNSKANVANTEVQLEQKSNYPWEGKVTINVTPSQSKRFTMMVRIPGWAYQKPVPTNLYAFSDSIKNDYSVKVNGKKVSPKLENGYVAIDRAWNKGDVVEVELPMEVRRIRAIDNVVDDRGKSAIQRGPIVYCLEGKDQPDGKIFNKFIPINTTFEVTYEPTILSGIVTLSGKAKVLNHNEKGDVIEQEMVIKAIPYATWDNRGADQMAVWIPLTVEVARPEPLQTIASRSKTWVSMMPIQNDAPATLDQLGQVEGGVNDQWTPKSSDDTSKPYHYWWLKRGSEVSIEYEFEQPEVISQSGVYWVAFDHYELSYRTPEWWKLYYKYDLGNGKMVWKEVKTENGYETKLDCYNIVHFKPVKASGLRIQAKLQKGFSGGIHEWTVQ